MREMRTMEDQHRPDPQDTYGSPEQPDRRRMLGSLIGTAAAAAGLAGCATGSTLAPQPVASKPVMGLKAAPLAEVRLGLIGVGQRGAELAQTLCRIEGARITAIADIDAVAIDKTLALINQAHAPRPEVITGSSGAWERLIGRSDVDAVVIATPWELHTPMAVAAMRSGKHVFVETPAAVTLNEAWLLVDTSEATQRHCMMLESCCYGRQEMMLLNMIRQGLFGELVHAEGAYFHDLRQQLKEVERGPGSWRSLRYAQHNGNLYPTHGLGPVAQYFNIQRGDRFEYLNSQSSNARGLAAYASRELPPGHPHARLPYITGDVNTSVIKCASGRTILLQHDTTTPRPYSRLNTVVGTNGVFSGFPDRIAIEMMDGRKLMTPSGNREASREWDSDMKPWFERFDHPLWKQLGAQAQQGGAGGMDFVMMWRVIYNLRQGLPMDQDVYDAAAWSAVLPLSCESVADRGNAKDFPDFTRGRWKTPRTLGVMA
jgi:hypothetical protein